MSEPFVSVIRNADLGETGCRSYEKKAKNWNPSVMKNI